jgi:signal peptidase II
MKYDTVLTKALPFSLTAVVLAADQAVKSFIVKRWPVEGSFIADVFNNDLVWLYHVRNKAIAFSLGRDLPNALRPVLFIALPLLVLGFLVWVSLRTDEFTRLQRWAIAGIIGGGLGNLIDRVFRPDGVVDYVSVKFFGLFGLERWPTFNIADSAVVMCVLLFIVSLFVMPRTDNAPAVSEGGRGTA